MILKRSERKNPLKQAQYGPRKFDAPTWPGVIFLGAFSALLAWFDVLGWRALYKDHAGEALTLVAVFCEFGALLFALYMTWRIRHDKKAGAALIFAFVACSAFNVFGGVQSTQLAMYPIEQKRWERAQFELDAKRAVAAQALAAAEVRLPVRCAPDTPLQTACAARYEREMSLALTLGDVDEYKAAKAALSALPLRAVVEPLLPTWAPWLAFSAFAVIVLIGPWMVGFGRPAPEPQAALNPIPDEISSPDGEAKPHLPPVTPQEVEQNVPPPAPLKPGYPPYQIHPPVAPRDAARPEIASIEDRVRVALRTPGADGKMPSVNEVAKALGPEIKRWRVQQIAAEMRGAA